MLFLLFLLLLYLLLLLINYYCVNNIVVYVYMLEKHNTFFVEAVNYAHALSNWFTGICVCLRLLSVSYFWTQIQERILRRFSEF